MPEVLEAAQNVTHLERPSHKDDTLPRLKEYIILLLGTSQRGRIEPKSAQLNDPDNCSPVSQVVTVDVRYPLSQITCLNIYQALDMPNHLHAVGYKHVKI